MFTTTHGASEDLLNEGFRRLAVNGLLWAAGLDASIRPDGPIDFVGPFNPTTYNFNGFVKGLKPSDMAGWDTPIPKKVESSHAESLHHEEHEDHEDHEAIFGKCTCLIGSRRHGARSGRRHRSSRSNPNEHIAIIGNTLAERFQYDGWLETMLQARFPKHELTVRNLGFSGDEIGDAAAFEELRHA